MKFSGPLVMEASEGATRGCIASRVLFNFVITKETDVLKRQVARRRAEKEACNT